MVGVGTGDTPAGGPTDASAGRFPATRWTLVNRAGGADGAGRVAVAEIARLYAPALRARLLQVTRHDEHRADDLLQGFLADKVLEQRLIGHADPARGRFRTFLLTALDRYVVDDHRRSAALRRSPQGVMQDIDDHRDALATGADRGAAFDVAWAREVLDEVFAAMRQQCEQAGRHDLWDVFQVRYVRPATEGTVPEPHASIAGRLHLGSVKQAENLLVTAKRMFTRLFAAVVSRYAVDDREVRDEVTDLWRLFAGSHRPE